MDKQPVLQDLKGVGQKLQLTLSKINIHSFEDLLFHFPFRFEDKTRLTPIRQLKIKQLAVVDAEVLSAKVLFGKRRSLSVALQDDSGLCYMRLFHFSKNQSTQLAQGTRIRVIGEPRLGSQGLEFYHPEYRLYKDTPPPLETNLSPVYPSCEDLTSQRISQLIEQALTYLEQHPQYSLLPNVFFSAKQQVSLNQMLRTIHKPQSWNAASLLSEGQHPFQKQLALEELVAHSLSAQAKKSKQEQSTLAFDFDTALQQQFINKLSFQLTAAQEKVISEAAQDMHSGLAMRRLIQGDVGSGKTLVAASLALQVLHQKKQVALMVPTEILAEQHAQNFSQWFEPFNIEVLTLLGKHSKKLRQQTLASIHNNPRCLIIGTHALFQKDVKFDNLALIIIDEQHRFGVHQRMALGKKVRAKPHQLIMTATPIPRSLAMTMYGDLDCSVIDELPPGRTPVKTVLIDNGRRQEVLARVDAACKDGAQAYWVCTLIEESESLQAQAAEALYEELQKQLPTLKLGLIHGRLKSDEKSQVIEAFRKGEINLLVATTVIEVGVDIPNANVMVIENPERLGLAQLHQLRGRVGRGAKESFCVLLYESPLGQIAKQRLSVMRDSNDGFVIAEKDLQIRGPGEVMGTRQAGMALFKVADLLRDADLLEQAKTLAESILKNEPEKIPLFLSRWLGNKQHYGDVG